MNLKNKTILAVGAHPDDVEYYAGGTLLGLAPDNRVFLVVATNGEIGGDPIIRKKEQEKAAKFLLAQTIFLDLPDAGLRNNPRLCESLIRALLKIKPDIVLSFDPEQQFQAHPDWHPDHRALSLAALDALICVTLPAYLKNLGLRGKFKKPEIWLFSPLKPNYFVDISRVWAKKRRLLKIFASQKLDLFEAEKKAREIGRLAKMKMAEGFKRL